MTQRSAEGRSGSRARRSALVLRILRWDEPLEEVARKAGVPVDDAERWMREFVAAGERALLAQAAPDGERGRVRIHDLERKLGEMALEMDRLRKQLSSESKESTDS